MGTMLLMAINRDRPGEQERIATVVGVLGVTGTCAELELLAAVNRVIGELREAGSFGGMPEPVWERLEPGDLRDLLERLERDREVERLAGARWRRPAHLLARDDQRFQELRDAVLAWWKTDPRSRDGVRQTEAGTLEAGRKSSSTGSGEVPGPLET
jgi:hypothetical protein